MSFKLKIEMVLICTYERGERNGSHAVFYIF